MAFNMIEERLMPYPQKRKLTLDNIRGFVEDYVSGQSGKKSNFGKSGDKEAKKILKNADIVLLKREEYQKTIKQDGIDIAIILYGSKNSTVPVETLSK
jgi:hypothetical protein